MDHYAGIDASLERSSVCLVDAAGRIIREAKVPSEPEALVGFFSQLGPPPTRIAESAQDVSCNRWYLENASLLPPTPHVRVGHDPRR